MQIFIGSSTEAKRVANLLQVALQGSDPAVQCTVWHQGIAEPTRTILESLDNKRRTFSAAVLVLTPDDSTASREKISPTARDNVILELGLFMGTLGRGRVFLVEPSGAPPRLPSDLDGVTRIRYDEQRFATNAQATIGAVSTSILESLRDSRLPRIPDIDIGAFYSQTGLTHAWPRREDAKGQMLQDIARAAHTVTICARVYISNLVKDTSSFADALQAAALLKQQGTIRVTFASTDPETHHLGEQAWQEEDPSRERWATLVQYQEHLRSGDYFFKQAFARCRAALAGKRAASLEFERRRLGRALPYSLLVLDERTVFVSFYGVNRQPSYGTYAPTMRLDADGTGPDTWAHFFLSESVDLLERHSRLHEVLA